MRKLFRRHLLLPRNSHLGGEFLIVAPYDDTKVTITSNTQTTLSDDDKTIGHDSGAVWNVTLAKGQTYLVQSTGRNFGVGDLTGSRVTSTKPIAFLTGHQRAQIETSGDNSKDHMIEMIPPTNRWGTEYIGIPQASRKDGNYYRLISAESGNVISITGRPNVTLDKGQYVSLSDVTAPTVFSSMNGKRFLVMEYAHSQNYNGDPALGDPFMSTLVPISGYERTANFMLQQGSTAFKNFVTVIAPTSSISGITLREGNKDTKLLSAYSPVISAIPGSVYSSAVFVMKGDPVIWSMAGPENFSVSVYGVSDVDAYGYPGAFGFNSSTDLTAPEYTLIQSDICGNITMRVRDDNGIADIFPIAPGDTAMFHTTSFTDNYTVLPSKTFKAGDTATIIEFLVTDATKPATLALYILDQGGNDTIFTSSYTPRLIDIKLDAPFPTVTRVGDTICRVVTVRNLYTDTAFVASSELFPLSGFQLTPVEEYWVAPNDSLKFDLCFVPVDSIAYRDSITFGTTCYNTGLLTSARAAYPKMVALDHSFGVVQPNVEVCEDVEIENRGELPITVVGHGIVGDSSFFVKSPAFPFTIEPGASQTVTVCFFTIADTGHFESRFDWVLEHPTSFYKTYSLFNAVTQRSLVIEEAVSSLQLWPNPATDLLNISLPESEKILRVSAIDMLGNEHGLAFATTSAGAQASTASLPSGSYSIAIETRNGRIMRQLVIKR